MALQGLILNRTIDDTETLKVHENLNNLQKNGDQNMATKNLSRQITGNEAVSWLNGYDSEAPRIFVFNNGKYEAANGFVFDVADIQDILNNLVSANGHELYIGFVKKPDNSHSLIVSGVKHTPKTPGQEEKRELLYEADTPGIQGKFKIYDYCNPCPPANPASHRNTP